MLKEISLYFCFVVAPSISLGFAQGSSDWPQYMGPERTGRTELSGVDFQWSEDGPEIAWQIEVGPGFGGASVRDGEVYLLDREPGELDILRVIELETGEPIWDAIYESPGRLMYRGSRSVPTVTEKFVVTCGGMGRVMCFDREDQLDVWSIDLAEEYYGNLPTYGWSCSPLVVDDMVVMTVLGDDIGLAAFDLASGDKLWTTKPVGTSHSTPVLFDLLGELQIAFVSSPPGATSLNEAGVFTISSFSPKDGSLLWETETLGSTYPIPGPVQVGNDKLFITGGYRGGSALLQITKKGDEYSFERLFYSERGAQVHNPILYDEHLYLVVNENWNQPRNLRKEGGLLCLGLDGTEKWRTGSDPYFGRGNVILAGDHLLVQDGFNGTLRVVKASPKGYEEVASAAIFGENVRGDKQMWGAMALAGRHLLMRSQDTLVCVELE